VVAVDLDGGSHLTSFSIHRWRNGEAWDPLKKDEF
jgi:hypothetical protein